MTFFRISAIACLALSQIISAYAAGPKSVAELSTRVDQLQASYDKSVERCGEIQSGQVVVGSYMGAFHDQSRLLGILANAKADLALALIASK
jgi:hypothetical protein